MNIVYTKLTINTALFFATKHISSVRMPMSMIKSAIACRTEENVISYIR